MKNLLPLILTLTLTACSVDVLPVHYSQVNSARKASEPVKRGPDAPGAFKRSFQFSQNRGYQFDPSKIELKEGVARLRSGSAGGRAVLETSAGIPYSVLDGFGETVAPEHRGVIRYQLSHDGATWHYHDGKKWVPAGPNAEQANTAAELSTRIQSFHQEVGSGTLYLRAFLIAPTGKEPVALQGIQVAGVAPSMDGWN